MRRERLSGMMALCACVGAALYVVRYRTIGGWPPAFDLYAYFYPKVLYALASLRAGGAGLLWNPYQNCGQPFAALPQTGLFYPVYLLFLAPDPEIALRAVLLVHLVIGGVGAFALGRQLGARPTAALVGALTFELGNSMLALTVSSPIHCAPLAWMPVALWACERLLGAPSLRRAITLALVLAIMILPGMPQTVFFTYQVIAFRVCWQLITGPRSSRMLLLCLVALVLPLGLAAVELLPELDVVADSLRGGALSASELSLRGVWSFAELRTQLGSRSSVQPFLLVPVVVGSAAFASAHTRRSAICYAGAGLLFAALAFGPESPVYYLYSHLPLTTISRQPSRFLWVTSFCLSPIAALGAESIASLSATSRRRLPLTLATSLLAIALFHTLTPAGLVPFEWAAVAVVLAAAVAAAIIPTLGCVASAGIALALLLQLIMVPQSTVLFLLPTQPAYDAAEAVIREIRPALGPEDRVHFVHRHPQALRFRLMPKTASLLRIPSVSDYEPLANRRYAELFTMMQTSKPLQSLVQFVYAPESQPKMLNRPLLDLLSVRYLIVDDRLADDIAQLSPPFRPVVKNEDFSVFENSRRFPRAFYVPRIEVVPDPAVLLDRLAAGTDDLRQLALVERLPASGFRGGAAGAVATVRFIRNEAEDVALEVDAAAPGFVVLSDQYFPRWSATVNGTAAEIERANYAFRLVAVPAGHSLVAFRYSSNLLWLGASLSAVSALCMIALSSPIGAIHALTRAPDTRGSPART